MRYPKANQNQKSFKVKINRLWLGKYASVRDYQVKKALKEKKDLVIELEANREKMHIPYEEIKKRALKTDVVYTSRINGKKYKLVDFKWERQKSVLDDIKNFSKLVL